MKHATSQGTVNSLPLEAFCRLLYRSYIWLTKYKISAITLIFSQTLSMYIQYLLCFPHIHSSSLLSDSFTYLFLYFQEQFKDWQQCIHLPSCTSQASHCSAETPRTPLPSLPLHSTSKLFQAIALEYCSLDALNFKQRGLTMMDASTDLVAHLVCFFICTEKD